MKGTLVFGQSSCIWCGHWSTDITEGLLYSLFLRGPHLNHHSSEMSSMGRAGNNTSHLRFNSLSLSPVRAEHIKEAKHKAKVIRTWDSIWGHPFPRNYCCWAPQVFTCDMHSFVLAVKNHCTNLSRFESKHGINACCLHRQQSKSDAQRTHWNQLRSAKVYRFRSAAKFLTRVPPFFCFAITNPFWFEHPKTLPK